MISATRRAFHGTRDICGDGVDGCRHARRQREQHEPKRRRPPQLGGRATTPGHRRRARLVRLVYVVAVAGIGLVLVQATRLSAERHWGDAETMTSKKTALRARARWWPEKDQAAAVGWTTAGVGARQVEEDTPFAPPGDGVWNRRLETNTSTTSEGQQEIEELTEEEAEAAATAEACADNAFSGGGAGKVVLLVVAILFTFNGLAIVCDEFFQASLEKISEVLGLTPDVAGATFLAAGSSAPELFTSIADVFGPSNSIGVGTIVGSAMFNVLVIVALSAAVAAKSGASGVIDHRVVARDVSFYTCSIFMLVASANDGEIQWWEALFMVLGYGLYIAFMIYNSRILSMCSAPRGTVLPTAGGLEMHAFESPDKPRGSAEEGSAKPFVTGDGGGAETRRRSSVRRGSADSCGEGGDHRRVSHHLNRRASRALRVSHLQEQRMSQARRASYGAAGDGGNEDPLAAAAAAAVAAVSKGSTGRLSWDGHAEEPYAGRGGVREGGGGGGMVGVSAPQREPVPVMLGSKTDPERAQGFHMVAEDPDDLLAWPEGWLERFLFIFGLPFMVGLSLTVPDCSRPKYEKYYILTFVMSISWISMISSYMVELATGAACILGVSAIVMGVLVLAVGTSVPDMIGSMIAARNGEASMAIANAIGSNVFNILLGLGGPWLFSSLMSGEPTAVDSEGATKALIILFCAVLIFVVSLIASSWSMSTVLAYCLLGTYGAYVLYTILDEVF